MLATEAGSGRSSADVRNVAALAEPPWPTAESRWGGLDAAIGCAGVIAGGAPQWEVPRSEEQAVLDVAWAVC